MAPLFFQQRQRTASGPIKIPILRPYLLQMLAAEGPQLHPEAVKQVLMEEVVGWGVKKRHEIQNYNLFHFFPPEWMVIHTSSLTESNGSKSKSWSIEKPTWAKRTRGRWTQPPPIRVPETYTHTIWINPGMSPIRWQPLLDNQRKTIYIRRLSHWNMICNWGQPNFKSHTNKAEKNDYNTQNFLINFCEE